MTAGCRWIWTLVIGSILILQIATFGITVDPVPPFRTPLQPVYAQQAGVDIIFDREVYSRYSQVFLSIIAPSDNADPDSVEAIDATVSSSRERLPITLRETGSNTGIFATEFILQYDLSTSIPDTITAEYGGASASVSVLFHLGQIMFDKDSYSIDERAVVRVIDPDEDVNFDVRDHVTVALWNGVDANGLPITLEETGATTGIFEKVITFTSSGSSSGDRVRVHAGFPIQADYIDLTVPDGGSRTLSVTVLVEGAAAPVGELTVMTDKSSYRVGEIVIVSGTVPVVIDNVTPVTIQVLNPQGELYLPDQVVPRSDGTYSASFTAGGSLATTGIWTVIAQYSGQRTQTTFELIGGAAPGGIIFTNLRIVDRFGNPLSEAVRVGQQVLFTATVQNTGNSEQPFAYLLSTDRIQEDYHWITGTIGPGQEFDPAMSQVFDSPGTYTMEAYLFDNVEDRNELAPRLSVFFEVQGTLPPPTPPADAPPAVHDLTVDATLGSSRPGCEAYYNCFQPYAISINVGDTVVWTNKDSASHTVTSGNPGDAGAGSFFDSGVPLLAPGQTFRHTFNTAGEFPYWCVVHPWMSGWVIVGPTITPPGSLTVETDKRIYMSGGETVRLSGTVPAVIDNVTPVAIQVLNPQGKTYTIDQVVPRSDGTYSLSFAIGGRLAFNGVYTVDVRYSGQSASTTFEFRGAVIQPPTPPLGGTSVACGDNIFNLEASLSNGSIVSIIADVAYLSLVLDVTTDRFRDGTMTVTLPRDLLDAKIGAGDDQFFVLVDGEEMDYQEVRSTSTERTLMVPLPAGSEEVEIIGTQICSLLPPLPPEGPPTPSGAALEVFTEDSYNTGDLVTVFVRVLGVDTPLPLAARTVAISVSDPNNISIISRTLTADESGFGELSFRLPDNSPEGTYSAVATASLAGIRLTDSHRFNVEALGGFGSVSIISVQATDQLGNPVSSFSRGSMGFAKVIVMANSNVPALVTVNLVDSDLTTIGLASIKSTLVAGQSEMLFQFNVPADASIGSADIYANVLTDWPASGGTPLTVEESASVNIG